MMAKAVNGLGWAAEAAPVVVAAPLPAAKIYIVLGSEAMKKFFPELHGGPGQWLKAPDGADVLVTYSPEYILRFDASLPAVYEKKKEMWMSLKAAKQRIGK